MCDHNPIKELRILGGTRKESRSLCLCMEERADFFGTSFLGFGHSRLLSTFVWLILLGEGYCHALNGEIAATSQVQLGIGVRVQL